MSDNLLKLKDDRITHIRQVEKAYHDACYQEQQLFAPGSWLHKPVQTVMDSLQYFNQYANLAVLDLGSGVGRNSIPIAQSLKGRAGQVTGVDLLPSAIEGLKAYSVQYEVDSYIKPVLSDIEGFRIEPIFYDFIVAVSALEHVQSEEALKQKLQEMVDGTKDMGINCLIVNANVTEVELATGEVRDPMFEVNLSTEEMLDLLNQAYSGWTILQHEIKPLEFEIEREQKQISLAVEAITYVARKI